MHFEDSYKNRMGLMTVLGGYIKAVIDDKGLKKALEYNKRSAEIDCTFMMKDFVTPESYITPEEVRESLQQGNQSGGIDGSVEVVGNEVISSNRKCVYYDGWIAAGLKAKEIEKLCIGRFETYGKLVWQRLNPNIETELRQFKEKSEDLCLEIIKFKD
jgi:hypothetical protein